MENSRKPLNISVVTDNDVSLLQSTSQSFLGTSALQGIALTGIFVIGFKVVKFIATVIMKDANDVIKGKIVAAVNMLVSKKISDIWKYQYGEKGIYERFKRELSKIERIDYLGLARLEQTDRMILSVWIRKVKKKIQTFDEWKENEKEDLAEWMNEEKDNIYKIIRKEKEKLEELERKKKENIAEWKDKECRDFDDRVRRRKEKLTDWEHEQKERFTRWTTIVKDELDEWERKEKTEITNRNRDEKKKIEEWITNKRDIIAKLLLEQK